MSSITNNNALKELVKTNNEFRAYIDEFIANVESMKEKYIDLDYQLGDLNLMFNVAETFVAVADGVLGNVRRISSAIPQQQELD